MRKRRMTILTLPALSLALGRGACRRRSRSLTAEGVHEGAEGAGVGGCSAVARTDSECAGSLKLGERLLLGAGLHGVRVERGRDTLAVRDVETLERAPEKGLELRDKRGIGGRTAVAE